MLELGRVKNKFVLVLKRRYLKSSVQQCIIIQNMLTACKLAYVQYDKAENRFVLAKRTHLFNLVTAIILVASLKWMMIFELIYSAKKTDFEYALFGLSIVWGFTGLIVCGAMIFHRDTIIWFLNWYIPLEQALKKGTHLFFRLPESTIYLSGKYIRLFRSYFD